MHCSAPTVFLVFLAQPTSLRNSKRSSCLGQTSENKNSAHVCQTASGIARKCSGLQVTHDNRVLGIIDALCGWRCGFCPTLNFHWRHNLTNNIIRPICDRTNSGYEARTEVPSTVFGGSLILSIFVVGAIAADERCSKKFSSCHVCVNKFSYLRWFST